MAIPLKVLTLTLLVCGSTACSHIGSKSPDEMVRHAMQHNLTRDNQYQFEGHVSFVSEAPAVLPPAAAARDSAADTPALADADALSDAVAEVEAAVAAAKDASAGSYQARKNRTNELARHFFKNT